MKNELYRMHTLHAIYRRAHELECFAFGERLAPVLRLALANMPAITVREVQP